MTAELDLTAYLAAKGVTYYRASGSEVTTHCWWCSDGDPKGKGKLYLNTESWLYSCKRCDAAGNRITLLQHFGDDDELKHAAGADPMLRRRILGEVTDLAHEMLLANEKMLNYLLDRGIHEDLILSEKLGFVPKNVGVSDMIPSRDDLKGYTDLIAAGVVTLQGREFFNNCITIPYFSHGTVVSIRGRFFSGDAKYKSTSGDDTRVYNGDALWNADRALVVEGELDTLAVRSQIIRSQERTLTDLAVVGLPGAGIWPEGFVKSLQEVRKVFVGLDPDETGRKWSDKLVKEVGNKAREVLLPPGEPKIDWTDYFKPQTPENPRGGQDWRDLRELLVEADLAGKQLFSIADIRTKWNRHRTEAPGLKLGWPSFDGIITPGLRPGQVMIPLAKSGTGKTVFLSNVAYNLRKHHVLYVSLEMTAAEVYEHMRRIHKFHYPKALPDEEDEILSRLRVVERNRVAPGDLGDYVKEYTEDVGARPELLIIDYLQYLARGFRGGTPYERVGDAIMEVKAVSKEESIATIVPSQVNRGAEHGKPISTDDARDSGVVEETGDFVCSLFRPDQLVDKATNTDGTMLAQTGVFKSQFLKSRHGGKGRIASLQMSLMSLAIVDTVFDKKGAIRVEQENALYRQGLAYEVYRRQIDGVNGQEHLV